MDREHCSLKEQSGVLNPRWSQMDREHSHLKELLDYFGILDSGISVNIMAITALARNISKKKRLKFYDSQNSFEVLSVPGNVN